MINTINRTGYSDYRVLPIGGNLSLSVSLPKGAGKTAYAIENNKTKISIAAPYENKVSSSSHSIIKISYDLMA